MFTPTNSFLLLGVFTSVPILVKFIKKCMHADGHMDIGKLVL